MTRWVREIEAQLSANGSTPAIIQSVRKCVAHAPNLVLCFDNLEEDLGHSGSVKTRGNDRSCGLSAFKSSVASLIDD